MTGSAVNRGSARSRGTVSATAGRAGRKPARASATVLVLKNSRPAGSAFVAAPVGSVASVCRVERAERQDAGDRAECDLAEAADGSAAHDVDQLAHVGADVGRAAAA